MILACGLLAYWTVQIIGEEGHNFIRDYDTKQHRYGICAVSCADALPDTEEGSGCGFPWHFLQYVVLTLFAAVLAIVLGVIFPCLDFSDNRGAESGGRSHIMLATIW